MSRHRILVASLMVLLLCSCRKKPEAPPAASTPTGAGTAAVTASVPDVGKVDTVPTVATGYGDSVASATTDAMKTALLQVNGATIDSGSVQARFGLDVTNGQDSDSIRGTAFRERVAQSSGGAITNFRIQSIKERSLIGRLIWPGSRGAPYAVTIEANIAHFTAADDKKLKVVVAPLRFDVSAFNIGGAIVPARTVSDAIRQQVAAALTATGRFSVLDREADSDIDQEIEFIQSGQARRGDAGKLGQAFSADVIWVGHINSLAYNRNVTALRLSNRELVSYSGGWAISQKLVNVATRQVLAADSLQGNAPSMAPTTMSNGINSDSVLQGMVTNIADQVVASIVSRTYPVSIIDRDGNTVTLSQGGKSLKPGARYAVIALGKEEKDPQTGESLGRNEIPCCNVIIDRVTDKLSYGHLESVQISLDGITPGQLLVRGEARASSAQPGKQAAGESSARRSQSASAEQAPAAVPNVVKAPVPPKDDGKW
ncbi:MAG: CsgG/HfaB family protein [Acidobacteriaceae bacterium]|nr:CsgG/HfaB family protein [Acidobacteriaceae bacterium]